MSYLGLSKDFEKYYIYDTGNIRGPAIYVVMVSAILVLLYIIARKTSNISWRVYLVFIILACIGVVSSVFLSSLCVEIIVWGVAIEYSMHFSPGPFTIALVNIMFLLISSHIYFVKAPPREAPRVSKGHQRVLISISYVLGQAIRVMLLRDFMFRISNDLKATAKENGYIPLLEQDVCIGQFFWETVMVLVIALVVIFFIVATGYAERKAKLSYIYLKSKDEDKIRDRY